MQDNAFRKVNNRKLNSDINFYVADNITVGSDGIVKSVVENDEPNRFFDEDGNELFFNDPNNVDKMYSEGQWSVGERLYTPLSYQQVNQAILDAGIIFERSLSGLNSGFGMMSWMKAALKGHGSYDFAENYLVNEAEFKINSDARSRSRANYW